MILTVFTPDTLMFLSETKIPILHALTYFIIETFLFLINPWLCLQNLIGKHFFLKTFPENDLLESKWTIP